MNRHMKTHLVNDVFVSPCGKQFSRFDAIDRHRKRTGCERCQADFDKMNRSLGGEGPGSIPLKH